MVLELGHRKATALLQFENASVNLLFQLSRLPINQRVNCFQFRANVNSIVATYAHCWWLCALTSVLRNMSICGDFLAIVKLHFYATKNQICCVTRGRLNATSRKNFRSEIIRLFLGRTVATPTRRSSRLTRPSDFSEDDETRFFGSTTTFIFPPKSPSFEVENKTKINGNIPHCSESNWDRDGIRTKDRQEFLKSSPASFPQILSPRSSFLFFVFGVSRPIWGTTHPRRRQPSSPGPRSAASAAAATNGQQRNNSCVLLVVRDVCVKACESASIIFKKKKAEDT